VAADDGWRFGLTELHFLTAAEVARRFSDRSLSPVEYLEALFERIDRLDPQLNVFITQDRDRALAAAHDAHRQIAAGTTGSPLRGIPVGVKDVFDIEGLVTTCGSRVPPRIAATEDATSVAWLRQAGAVFPGKVQTLEFATGGPGFDLPLPPTRNPWDLSRYSGGSSSGSGAGVAAGLFPLALGSDTGGSVRNPASCCGVVGLKATYGLISRRGVFPLAFSLDHVGVIARSVEDAAIALDVIARYDDLDVSSRRRPATDASYTRELARDLRGLKIGFVRHFHETDMKADDEISASVDEAARHFAKLGAEVREIQVPSLNDFTAVGRIISAAEGWAVHADWVRTQPESYGALTRRRLVSGAFVTSEDYIKAQRQRGRLIRRMAETFNEVDLLLTASSMDLPPLLEDEKAYSWAASRHARTPFNVTGSPAITLMSGLSKAGLPLSIQLAASHWRESTLLGAASAYERSTEWHRMRPSLAA
jgi:aspartyl-tRNA(Asn)/glutamyl-tRNA(Gln) amidotransferase subunit A